MNCTFILASLFTLVPVARALAQRPAQGFVITTQGDTVRGELFQTNRDARKQLIHLKAPSRPAVTYPAAAIRGFGRPGQPLTESKTYAPGQTPVLVEALVKGPVSLYKGYMAAAQDPRYAPDVRYYVQTPSSPQLQLLEESSLVLSLAQSMGDCTNIDLAQRVGQESQSYNSKFLKSLVEEYAACRFSTKPTPVAESYHGWYTSWGAKGGISQVQLETSVGFNSLPEAKSTVSMGWQGGVFATLANWNGFAIQFEALLVQLQGSFTNPVYSGTSLYSISREAELRMHQLRVPVMLRYQAGHGLVRPFVMAGPHLGYRLSKSGFIADKRSDQASPNVRSLFWPDPLVLGVQGGAGLYLSLPKMPGISLESVYSLGQQGSGNTLHISYTDLAFSAAVYF